MDTHRRVRQGLAAFLSVFVVFIAAGCGATPGDGSGGASGATTGASSGGDQALVIEAAGFSQKGDEIGYGAIIANPSAKDALQIHIAVRLLDADGKVIRADSGALTGIPDSSKFAYGGQIFLEAGDKPAKIEVVAEAGSWDNIDLALPDVTKSGLVNKASRGTTVVGQVTNTLDATLSSNSARIGIVLYDKQQRVVGGGFTYLTNDLKSGGKARFEAGNGLSATPWSTVDLCAVSMENSCTSD
jgi:hypothetical protein